MSTLPQARSNNNIKKYVKDFILEKQTGRFPSGCRFTVESTDSHLPDRALQWQAGASALRAGVLLTHDFELGRS
jgi:hypothetical protein